jgi:hypothetical protein
MVDGGARATIQERSSRPTLGGPGGASLCCSRPPSTLSVAGGFHMIEDGTDTGLEERPPSLIVKTYHMKRRCV